MHIPRGSGQVRFRRVPVQMPIGEVPEGSGADAEVRFRKNPVQKLGQVPDGSGAG